MGIIVTTADVHATEVISFAKGSSTLSKESSPLIDELVAMLKDNPDVGPLSVRGHATPDETSPPSLAMGRATVVVEALVKAGAARKRLVAESGPALTVDDSASGRVVDFEIAPAAPAERPPRA